jgi:tetratricopeptide (TPR) repeat protein
VTVADRVARLYAAAQASSDNGRPALAARQIRAGLRLLDATPTPDGDLLHVRGRLLVSLAWAESERGRVDVGFRLLDEAEPLVGPTQRAVLLAQRALLLKRGGRDDLALRQYSEAIGLLTAREPSVDLVKALNNRSALYLDQGDVRSARADLRRCAQLAEKLGLTLGAAIVRANLGCLDVLAGDLPAALRTFGQVHTEYEVLAPGRLAPLRIERARALVAAGLFGEADRELAEALAGADQQALSHHYADALQVRAEAALLAGRPVAAGVWARHSRQRFLDRDNARRAVLARLLELRADHAATGHPGLLRRASALAARLGRLGLAEDARVAGLVAARILVADGHTRRAERIVARHGPPGRVDRLDTRLLWRLTLAELAAGDGRPSDASRHLLAGMATLHRHRTQFGSLDLQTGAAVHGRDLARAGLGSALASGSVAAVYRWSERARAQALLLPPVRPPDNPGAAQALEELRQVRHAMRTAELAGRPLGNLRARAESLQRTVREHSWSAPGQRGSGLPTPAPAAAVEQALGDAALVAYLRDGTALWALVLVGRSAFLAPLGEYAPVEEAVLRLRADLDAQAGRAMPLRLAEAVADATRRDATALAAAVLDPLLPRIGDRDLVVVPTGVLVTVPWSVLPGCAGRPVTVAPSATVWLSAALRLRAQATGSLAATLLVAGPGNARGEPEIQAIAAIRPHATVLTGSLATPAATLAAFTRVSVAHLAAHGHHQAENALFSTLELAGGPLLGYDLQRVGRTPPMVVLSSCDLGLTDVRPGDETFGMATALLNAGTATVIASVSRVADDEAMAVMTGYHRAVGRGRSPAAALAEAASPLAGFVCFGAG